MSHIITYTGKYFSLLDPDPESIDIEDIAHSLSNICRFGGHPKHYFSIAQHCLLVTELLPTQLQLAGLMLHASKAYSRDIHVSVPPHIKDYVCVETDLTAAIAARFSIPLLLTAATAEAKQSDKKYGNEGEVEPDPDLGDKLRKADKIAFHIELVNLLPKQAVKKIIKKEEIKLATQLQTMLYLDTRTAVKEKFLSKFKDLTT
jgi:hypothetical protein